MARVIGVGLVWRSREGQLNYSAERNICVLPRVPRSPEGHDADLLVVHSTHCKYHSPVEVYTKLFLCWHSFLRDDVTVTLLFFLICGESPEGSSISNTSMWVELDVKVAYQSPCLVVCACEERY